MTNNIQPTTYQMTAFFVLPVEYGGDGKTQVSGDHEQACKYYVYDPVHENYVATGLAQLKAIPSGDFLDFVSLQQLPLTAKLQQPLPKDQPTPGATLFSATAKTLSAPDGYSQPQVFVAASGNATYGPNLIVPLTPSEMRGVVLVFSVTDPTTKVTVLRGSFDPEIKGSTNP